MGTETKRRRAADENVSEAATEVSVKQGNNSTDDKSMDRRSQAYNGYPYPVQLVVSDQYSFD